MIITTNTAVTLLCYYSLPSQTVAQATHSPLPARYCSYKFGRAQIRVDVYARVYTRTMLDPWGKDDVPSKMAESTWTRDKIDVREREHDECNAIVLASTTCQEKVHCIR